MRKLLLFAMLLLPCALWGQDSSSTVLLFNGTPTGACPAKRLAVDYANNLLYFCSNAVWVPATAGAGTGSVTSVATTTPITGGTITTTGTIACATCVTSAASLTSTGVVIGGGLQATSTNANLTWSSPALTIGVATSTTGVLKQTGASSGTVTVTPQAAAGTPTLTYPTASGTFAVSATAPIVVSATTGNITLNPATTSVQGGVIPRDNLTVDGSGNLDYTTDDSTTLNIDEEFVGGNNTTGTVGAYGWQVTTVVGGTPTLAQQGGVVPNFGIQKILSAAVSGDGVSLTLGSSVGLDKILNNVADLWDSYWEFAPGASTGVAYRLGWFTPANATVVPATGAYVRFDTNLSDTTYVFCVSISSVETCDTTSGIAPVANTWVKLRIQVTSALHLSFTLYNAAGAVTFGPRTACASGCDFVVTTSSAQLSPGATVTSYTVSTAQTLLLDFFKAKIRGIAR